MNEHKESKNLKDNLIFYMVYFIKKRPRLKEQLEQYTAKIPLAEFHYNLYLEYIKLGEPEKAEDSLKEAIYHDKKPTYFYELGMYYKQKKKWFQAVEAFCSAIELSTELTPSWYKEYALCLKLMNRFYEASVAWEKALSKGSKNANDWYLYGYTLELAGKQAKAKKVYIKAIKFDKNKNEIEELGIGAFHQKRGDWIAASNVYRRIANEKPFNANVQYKLAHALDRCYEWEEAEEKYLNAISLEPENIDWYYKLGFVRERAGKYYEAAEAYSFAADKRKSHTPYWYYRTGYVFNKLGRYKEACEAFLMMNKIKLPAEISENKNTKVKKKSFYERFSNTPQEENISKHTSLLNSVKNHHLYHIEKLLLTDTTNTAIWHKLAKIYEKKNEVEKAASTYKKLIDRKESFDKKLFFYLGHMLALQGKYEEASRSFIEQRVLQNAHGMIETSYNNDATLKKHINYTEYYERSTLDDKTILYESYHGSSISCNPYAIFKSLLEDERFTEYQHIWVINDKSKIPDILKSHKNILFIKRNCDGYMRHLSRAKYLINNVSFPEYFIRKEGQIYLNTWHGTPIKSLGKDIKDDFMAHKNIARNFLQASHLIQPNSHTTTVLLERHDVNNIFKGVVAETGYPRQDLMLNITNNEKSTLKEQLNIVTGDKVVLYAPTWRGEHSEAVFDTTRLETDLEAISSVANVHLLFRGHHKIESLLDDININATIIPNEIDTNIVLSVIDILITDYSSIAFDFMALERPIIYYAYDREDYERERGFYFPLEDLGGSLCKTQKELISSLEKIEKSIAIDEKQKEAQNKYCSYDDGKASKRVIDLIFFDQKKDISIVRNTTKKSILFYGGAFIPNGITTSFVNLLNHIDTEKYSVSIVVDPNLIKNNSGRLEQFSKVRGNISTLGRNGRMLMTLEEKWVIEKFGSKRILATKEMYSLYKKSHSREFVRMFGRESFNSIVNFEGYSTFWTAIFAMKQKNTQKNTIYLHNDMQGEWKLRFPYLEKNFRLYNNYNTLAPVSKLTMEHNIKNLSGLFSLKEEQFDYCDNIQNPEYILARAKEPLENKSDKNIFKNTQVFINIARLSPEKDQEKLIRAFKKITKKYPKARLINLGSGPQEHHLQHVIKELNLQKKVFFLGQRSNPYPYLQMSDCFILSSNHEGQPMTLFEALVLEKPIIATDIVGNRSVIEGRPGHIVMNSEKGLQQGMLDFLEGKYAEDKTFDYETYNKKAMTMFYEKVVAC